MSAKRRSAGVERVRRAEASGWLFVSDVRTPVIPLSKSKAYARTGLVGVIETRQWEFGI